MQCQCAIMPSVACSAVQYISTLSHKRQDIRKKKIAEHMMCAVMFSTTLYETVFISD